MSVTITFTPGMIFLCCLTVFISPTFFIERQISDLTNKLYGIVIGLTIPLPLSQQLYACNLGVTCPMSPGTQYVQVVSLFIPLDWPLVSCFNLAVVYRFDFFCYLLQMQASIQWKMVDASAPNVGCFEIPVMIA